jgi:hypothetical protein
MGLPFSMKVLSPYLAENRMIQIKSLPFVLHIRHIGMDIQKLQCHYPSWIILYGSNSPSFSSIFLLCFIASPIFEKKRGNISSTKKAHPLKTGVGAHAASTKSPFL